MDNHHGGKKYIRVNNWVIIMNFYKALVYAPIWEPTQWDIENLDRVMLT